MRNEAALSRRPRRKTEGATFLRDNARVPIVAVTLLRASRRIYLSRFVRFRIRRDAPRRRANDVGIVAREPRPDSPDWLDRSIRRSIFPLFLLLQFSGVASAPHERWKQRRRRERNGVSEARRRGSPPMITRALLGFPVSFRRFTTGEMGSHEGPGGGGGRGDFFNW